MLAVDLNDRPGSRRSVEGFLLHMHRAWLRLLRARLVRDGSDDARKWDLARCVEARWPADDPVRRNLELTMAIADEIEPRDEEAAGAAIAGYAAATLVNFEDELTSSFGGEHSLAGELRFPVYVATFTPDGTERTRRALGSLPPAIAALVADARGAGGIPAPDPRFELGLHLVPRVGPADADAAPVTFLPEHELDDDQREALADLGRRGTVIVRERHRPVSNVDKLKPGEAARHIEARIPWHFSLYFHFIRAWKRLGVRPDGGARYPERTDERYCVYDAAHHDYLYTSAFVDLVVERVSNRDGFEELLGIEPRPK